MKLSRFALLLSFSFLFMGCPNRRLPKEYREGKFPDTPVNFDILNSVFDDYNSALPIISNYYQFHYSSNKSSFGNNFDITGQGLQIIWDQEFGTLDINKAESDWDDSLDTLFKMINTDNNEFGPYEIGYEYFPDPDTVIYRHLIV